MGRSVAVPASGDNRLLIGLSLLAVYTIWGSTYLAIRLSLESFPPFLLLTIRYLSAGSLLYAYLRLQGIPNPPRREWAGSAVIGLLLLVMGNGAVAFAEQWVSTSLTSLLVSTTPLWSALASAFYGRNPSRWEWGGLVVGLAGVAVLNLEQNLQANPLGVGVILMGAMAWGLGSVWNRALPLPKGLMAAAAQMLTGGLMLGILSGLWGERLTAVPTVQASLSMVYLVLCGSLIGFNAYLYLLRTVRIALATSCTYVNPVVAVLLGVGFAGETMARHGILGMVIILTGVILVVRGPVKPLNPSSNPQE